MKRHFGGLGGVRGCTIENGELCPLGLFITIMETIFLRSFDDFIQKPIPIRILRVPFLSNRIINVVVNRVSSKIPKLLHLQLENINFYLNVMKNVIFILETQVVGILPQIFWKICIFHLCIINMSCLFMFFTNLQVVCLEAGGLVALLRLLIAIFLELLMRFRIEDCPITL